MSKDIAPLLGDSAFASSQTLRLWQAAAGEHGAGTACVCAQLVFAQPMFEISWRYALFGICL
jgi:hypothetical protein